MGWRVKNAFGVDTLQDTFRAPDVKNTNNNGMKATVELLEAIYTNPNFPGDRAPYLKESLRDTGKSRHVGSLLNFDGLLPGFMMVKEMRGKCEGALRAPSLKAPERAPT